MITNAELPLNQISNDHGYEIDFMVIFIDAKNQNIRMQIAKGICRLNRIIANNKKSYNNV